MWCLGMLCNKSGCSHLECGIIRRTMQANVVRAHKDRKAGVGYKKHAGVVVLCTPKEDHASVSWIVCASS